ncbi:ATP-binding cassette domain-containing protein [Alphaproteobacteria bacterium]|jgi:simple sugar transport system ATP-binding protein|nr:ABC transporter ATP-binding protein [Chloroflexota bacterium]MDC0037443.1 ATP-binding cassette domain-containing protein [Alphaproteobacteria bacterium]|tara:strand:- start:1111 stop:1851 length:741 start_codon:yes stop_codon:yes gene_type:complete
MSEINLYEAKNVTKRYGNLTALDGVDFHIAPREVVGLLGDNGAGKSTLIKMMSGVVEPNQGSVFVEGKETKIKNRKESEELAGIETIYQNSALCDDMTIVRNIFMGREITNSLGFMNHKKMEEISTEVLTSGVEIAGIDSPNKEIGALSGGQKQAVAIARAVYFKRKILLLDEPTSALSVRETEKVLNYVTDLKKENVSSVIVTHNLYHAFQVCDRFVVMSHGKVVFEKSKQETNIEEVTEQVIKV